MDILTAQVTNVSIGALTIQGLLIEDGDFGVGFPQVCTLFDIPQKNASRDFKVLLGKDLTFLRVKIVGERTTMQVLSLPQVEKLIAKLDRKGNEAAQLFRDDMVGLSLTQLFSDAFGIKFEQQERQTYLLERLTHRKQFHPLYTAWLKADGIRTTYGTEVDNLKRACGLPMVYVGTYDASQLSHLNRAEASYNSLRLAGLSHIKALDIIAMPQQQVA